MLEQFLPEANLPEADVALNVYAEPSARRAVLEPLRVVVGLAIGLPLFVWVTEQVRGSDPSHGEPPEPEPVLSPTIVFVGLPLVVIGLASFAIGLRDGLMPVGDFIGRRLVHSQPRMVPSVAFTLGLLLTFGEPAIGSLIELSYEAWDFPEIQALLGKHQILTVVSIGAGVGLAMAVGATRLSSGGTKLPLWRLVSPLALLCLLSTCVTPPAAQGLAWDAGAVTTGPITVPVILALGAGFVRGGDSGFGLVALASLFPVLSIAFSCYSIKLWAHLTGTDTASERPARASPAGSLLEVAREEAQLTAQSFLPLSVGLAAVVLYLRLPLRAVARRPVPLGLARVLFGLYTFYVDIKLGLLPMGRNGGARLVRGVIQPDGAVHPARAVGVCVFGVLTIGACQMIEPDLLVLGSQAERLSAGRVPKMRLVATVAAGCGLGTVIGIVKVLLNLPLLPILLALYTLALALTYKQDDFLVGLAWDAAGTSTGSITVPLILALGLGIAEQVGAAEGGAPEYSPLGPLGILGCASAAPICTVLVWFRGMSL